IAIIAARSVCLCRVRTHARRGVTRARVMTLIRGRTHYQVGTRAYARLTRITLRTRIAVTTCTAITLGRVRACPGRGVTRARVMALIRGRTHHPVGARAGATLPGVPLRTRITIVTAHSVRLGRVRTHARRGVTRPWIMTLILSRTHH